MPDESRLLLVPSQLYKKFSDQFESITVNQNIQSSILIKSLTIQDYEAYFSEKYDTKKSYIYLDSSYLYLISQIGKAEKTIWLNEADELVIDEWPMQDVDLSSINEMGSLGSRLNNPTIQQCVTWWEEWNLPENIRRHVKTVAKAAYTLAILLRRRGIEVDPILTHRGGLMHDIDKIETLNQVMGHGEMGGDFFDKQGYTELGEIVRGHIMHTILEENAQKRSWENNLVYFCDKLVEGDQLVPFNYRLDQLKIRYPYYQPAMEKAEPYIWNLSDKVCTILSIPDHEHLIQTLISGE